MHAFFGKNSLYALFILTLIAPRESKSAFECKDETWEGTSEFLSIARTIAGNERVRLAAELDYGALSTDDAVLVLHPDILLDDVSLIAFIQHGGRAAVLDDFGKSSAFAERFGIRRIAVPNEPLMMLRGNRHLSVGTPVEATGAAPGTGARHPLVVDVDRIMLNHPSGLINPGLTPLLEIRAKDGTSVPIAVTGVVGTSPQGRLLFMSDPSALINLMIRYPGNLAFARALVRFLTEPDRTGRKGTLYIVANRFGQSGHFTDDASAWSSFGQRLERAFRDLQQGLPPFVLVLLAAVTTLAIARWVGTNAWRRSPPAIPRYLRGTALSNQAGWPGRAAVLTAPRTHPALLLLELRESFRARLAQLIAADPAASSEALIRVVESQDLLPSNLLSALRNLLSDTDATERAISARKPIRVSQAKLSRLLQQSLDILNHISQLEFPRREPSSPSQ